MVKWVSLALCCITSSALAQAESIRIVKEASQVAHCQRLAEVGGSSIMGGVFATVGYDNALKEMREKVLATGGTHLLLFDLTTGQTGANGMGEAYRCDGASEEPAPKPRKKR